MITLSLVFEELKPGVLSKELIPSAKEPTQAEQLAASRMSILLVKLLQESVADDSAHAMISGDYRSEKVCSSIDAMKERARKGEM